MNLILPKGDDGTVPRTAMPQIHDGDIGALLAYLGSLGVTFDAGLIDPTKVTAHQKIDTDIAMSIPDAVLRSPVLLSKDPAIIDGDHRWYRHLLLKRMMPFIRLNEDFNTSLQLIFSFPATTRSTRL